MSTWQPTAVVLVIEERECTCGRTYTCPSHSPNLELTHERKTKLARIPRDENISYEHLPRRLKYISTPTRVCAECWTIYDGDQLDLFPRKRPRRSYVDPTQPQPHTPRAPTLEELFS